jgi:hypothetical protein
MVNNWVVYKIDEANPPPEELYPELGQEPPDPGPPPGA